MNDLVPSRNLSEEPNGLASERTASDHQRLRNEKDFAGDFVEDHVAMRNLARVYFLSVIPWLRPFRQIRAKDVAGPPWERVCPAAVLRVNSTQVTNGLASLVESLPMTASPM